MQDKSRTGVVILNYNSHDLTVELVKQIISYPSIGYVCVVDNNSKDSFEGDFDCSRVIYIKNNHNIGYNAGNNIGLKYLVEECNCDYVFIANPDVDFENSSIVEMSMAMNEDEKLVIVSTKRFGYKGSNIHQYFDFPDVNGSIKKCFFLTRRNFERNVIFKQNYEIDNANGVFYVDAVPGAFFGIKASFLKKIDYLYEGIFLYGEELFIGKQASELGYKAGIINTSCYYHNHIQTRFGKANERMFKNDRLSLIKYYEKFELLNKGQLVRLKLAVILGSFEYKCMSRLFSVLKGSNSLDCVHPKCSHAAALYHNSGIFNVSKNVEINSTEDYLQYIAEGNYDRFMSLGHAVAGHNGPHGHVDTPVRNTAHYLIIYAYLYKETGKKKYKEICDCFFEYLKLKQAESKSGAIECMVNDQFDHLNGLIGQGWVIEALIYYYETFRVDGALNIALAIYKSQSYDASNHLWNRVELDGTNIGMDKTCNHQVMFAACSYKLTQYYPQEGIEETIRDFMQHTDRDFEIYSNGLLKHVVNIDCPEVKSAKKIKTIKKMLTPLRILDRKLFDYKYIERAYHIFDMYCFAILKQAYPDMEIFKSSKYRTALKCALDIDYYNKNNDVLSYIKKKKKFNLFSYSYNSPLFEYPYVAMVNGAYNPKKIYEIMKVQKELMYDTNTGLFINNNPDIETWNAKTYEAIRWIEYKGG